MVTCRRAEGKWGSLLSDPIALGRYAVAVGKRVRLPASRFGGADDREWPGQACRSVVVASAPRSGSTLLGHALGATELVGVPHEYFLRGWYDSGHRAFGAPVPTRQQRIHRLVGRLLLRHQWWGHDCIVPASLPSYVDGVVHRRTTGNGVFGLRIHWSTYARERELHSFSFSMLPQPITWIHIRREDLVAQAVSFAKAEQSGVFGVRGRAPRFTPPVYFDDRSLMAAFVRVRDDTRSWCDFFAEAGITPIEVTYEQLDADYGGTVSRVLAELGFPGVPVPPPVHVRQADGINAAWAERFRSLHPELFDDERREPL